MSKVISTKQGRLPSKGTPLDIYFCTDTKETFIAIGNGQLFSLPDLLAGAHAVPAVGPRGEQGLAGTAVAKGDKGDQGIPGRDGKDSTVPGPKGDRGDVLIVGESEQAAAVVALRLKFAKTHAALTEAFRKNAGRKSPQIKTIIDAVLRKFKADSEL